MANRYFNQFSLSFLKQKVSIYAQVAIGAAGAPTLSAVNSKGVASIARNSAGKYTVTLQDNYVAFVGVRGSVLLASGLAACVSQPCVVSQAVSTAKTVVVQFVDFAGAAVDPDNGAVVYLEIKLNNSSAQ
jgi:hypothetical protein